MQTQGGGRSAGRAVLRRVGFLGRVSAWLAMCRDRMDRVMGGSEAARGSAAYRGVAANAGIIATTIADRAADTLSAAASSVARSVGGFFSRLLGG